VTVRNGSGIIIGNIQNNDGWYDFAGSANVNGAQMSHPGTLRFLTNSAERMRIASDGGIIAYGNRTTNVDQIWDAGGTVKLYAQANTSNGYATLGTITNHALNFITNGSERARIDASGNLLVGLTTPQSGVPGDPVGISLFGSTAPGTAAFTRDSVNAVLYVNNKTSGGGLVAFYNGGASVGSITSNGTTTSYNTTSDVRLKHDIVDAPDAASLIDAIQVRSFKWNADNSHQRYGFVAQELLEVAPEAVHQPTDPDEMMAVDYSKLVPMLVKELQSVRARLAQLEGN
jgi:hypothetical protein